MSDPTELRFGPFRLIGRHGPLLQGDREIRLQPKSLAVLWLLVRQPGEVVTKSALLDSVWPGTAVGDEAITFQIQALRRALEDDPRSPRYIVTVHRVGYRFMQPVDAACSAPAPEAGSPFVGRGESLASLQALLAEALAGRRQFLLISGEAGIGKSTLIDRFESRVSQNLPLLRRARGQCLDQIGDGEPYLPLLQALTQLVREAPDEAPIALLRRTAPTWLLQLPGVLSPDEAAELRRQSVGTHPDRMMRELVSALEQLAAQRPLLLVLEDLHWADNSTLDFLRLLAHQRTAAQLLVIVSLRPAEAIQSDHPVRQFGPGLVARKLAQELRLESLSPDDVVAFLHERFAGQAITDTALNRVRELSGGHPLYLHQLADYFADNDADSGALPPALGELLELQYHQLAPAARQILDAGSLCGAEFAAAVVADATGLSTAEVEAHCDALVRQLRFIEDRGLAVWPDGTASGRYRFRHALHSEVLRRRLLPAPRARLSRAIALRLEAAYGARADDVAAELSLHFEESGLHLDAARYAMRAARQALRRIAPGEVGKLVKHGLELIAGCADSDTRRRVERELHMVAAKALQLAHGFGSAAAQPHLQALQALIGQDDDDAELKFEAWAAMWLHHHFTGRYAAALDFADRIRQLGEAQHNPATTCCGLAWHSVTLQIIGRPADALVESRRALQLARSVGGLDGHSPHFEPVCTALIGQALSLWYTGHPKQALATAREATAYAEHLGGSYATCIAEISSLGMVRLLQREWAEVAAMADDVIERSQRHGQTEALEWARGYQLIARYHLARDGAALAALLDRLERRRQGRNFVGLPMEYAIAAEILLDLRDYSGAEAALGTALDIIDRLGQRSWECELLRLRARHRRETAPERPESEESLLRRAIDAGRETQTLVFEFRATMNLFDLLARQGRYREAHELLASTRPRLTDDLLALHAGWLHERSSTSAGDPHGPEPPRTRPFQRPQEQGRPPA